MAMLRQFPILVVLLLGCAGLMLAPAIHALRIGAPAMALVFAKHALLTAAIAVILGLALANRRPRISTRYHLTTLLLIYVALPLALAAPLAQLRPEIGFGGAYFEMLSSLTTTGATLFEAPRLVAEPIHLWRALVAWSGGFVILVAAFAVLAPMNLGGFEIVETRVDGGGGLRGGTLDETTARIGRVAQRIAPVYALATGALTLLLIFAGDRPFVAVCHAMAVLSTSGVSPVGGLAGSQSGFFGEAAIALFLLAAVSHRTLGFGIARLRAPLPDDPEVRLMLISVLGVTAILFLRNFAGAAEIAREWNVAAAARAVWGGLFTVLSFLTTTGFESRDWLTMRLWSNLPAPGTILLGVAVMGGGVATTAGGVKLLRLYALYRAGQREMELLIHPSSVWAHGQAANAITLSGARVAFVFLLLFLASIALVMLALGAAGLDFQSSLTLGIAGLTTTGPAILTLDNGLGYADLRGPARAVFCAAMIVGRIEALVLIALLNPAFWR